MFLKYNKLEQLEFKQEKISGKHAGKVRKPGILTHEYIGVIFLQSLYSRDYARYVSTLAECHKKLPAIRDGKRSSSSFLVPRSLFSLAHSQGIDIITSRFLEVLVKFLKELENWKISSVLRIHNLSKNKL